jgi:hypothetical protein
MKKYLGGPSNVLSKAVSNIKTKKSEKSGEYRGAILYLTPEKSSGLGNVCPFASKGCTLSCLFTAGRGVMAPVIAGRLRKTKMFFQQKDLFFQTLFSEIVALQRVAFKAGKKPFVRLNGTSDINWGNFKVYNGLNIFEMFPDVQFYDYTKDIKKAVSNRQANYHLTFSRSESNFEDVVRALQAGINVAVVFKGKTLPKTFMGAKVLDGDKTDLRFEEGNQGAIIGLKAKGKARYDKTGFAIELPVNNLLQGV